MSAETIYWEFIQYNRIYRINATMDVSVELTGTAGGNIQVAVYAGRSWTALTLIGLSDVKTATPGLMSFIVTLDPTWTKQEPTMINHSLLHGEYALAAYISSGSIGPMVQAPFTNIFGGNLISSASCPGSPFLNTMDPVYSDWNEGFAIYQVACGTTFTMTKTPSVTSTSTPSSTATPTYCGACTATDSPTPTPIYSDTISPTPSVTPTSTRTFIVACDYVLSLTPTMTLTHTASPIVTATRSMTSTPTRTPSSSPSTTSTPSATATQTDGSRTPTPSSTFTQTADIGSVTATLSSTFSQTPLTGSITATPSSTLTPSPTVYLTPAGDELIYDGEQTSLWSVNGWLGGVEDSLQNFTVGGSNSVEFPTVWTQINAAVFDGPLRQFSDFDYLEAWFLPSVSGRILRFDFYDGASSFTVDFDPTLQGGFVVGQWNRVVIALPVSPGSVFNSITVYEVMSIGAAVNYSRLDDVWLRKGSLPTTSATPSPTGTLTSVATTSVVPSATFSPTPTLTVMSSAASATIPVLPTRQAQRVLPSANPAAPTPSNPLLLYFAVPSGESDPSARLQVFSASGTEIASVPCVNCLGPTLTFSWDGSGVGNGLYFATVDLGDGVQRGAFPLYVSY